jgi:hypothetical protein
VPQLVEDVLDVLIGDAIVGRLDVIPKLRVHIDVILVLAGPSRLATTPLG